MFIIIATFLCDAYVIDRPSSCLELQVMQPTATQKRNRKSAPGDRHRPALPRRVEIARRQDKVCMHVHHIYHCNVHDEL